MKLYDNDEYRDDFMELVYSLLHGDGDNYRANQIIDAFDSAPEVEAEPLPPNDPLTLEELREMDGEPVWVTPAKEGGKILKRWMLLECFSEDIDLFLFRPSCGIAQGYTGAGYGKIWLAYRRKLEEGTT